MFRPCRPLLNTFVLLVLGSLSACAGGEREETAPGEGAPLGSTASAPAPSRGADEVRTLGTIEASVGGESRAWYVVAGEARDGPYASGMWVDVPGEAAMIIASGLDTADPPVETFTRGGGDLSQISMGEYRGGSMSLNVQVDPAAALPLRLTVGDGPTSVIYLPVVDMSDMSGAFLMSSGTVTVEEVAVEGGEARLRGTFSGTLEAMGGGETMSVTDGRFDVRGMPSSDAVQPTGGT